MNLQPAVPAPGKILVVDDNPIIQRTLYFALRDRGYQVLMSGEIADALNVVRKERLDLILLDIHFPQDMDVNSGGNRDGFWALDWLHRMNEARGIPVIIISGDDPAMTGPRALAAGAAAYLHKPVNKEELSAAVAAALGGRPSAPPAEHFGV
jgi:two-component system KDP operon response regulator KdpE